MMIQLLLPNQDAPDQPWVKTKDGDPGVLSLYSRHYSRGTHARKTTQFVGPGEHMVLRTIDGLAFFVWRKFINQDHRQHGVNCAAFRNEGPRLSSGLIHAACALAWARWPGMRLYTYVNAARVRSKNPGYCFIAAGWARCGRSKKGLHIFERLPQ